MNITVKLLSSSSGNIYEINFDDSKGAIRCFCHCNAGVNGMMCKHKELLASEDVKSLATQEDIELFKQVIASPYWRDFRDFMKNYNEALKAMDKQIERIKKERKTLRESVYHMITFPTPKAPEV